MQVSEFVKQKRKALKLTQPELASKAGVGLRFVRELEQGKQTLKMDKVNQVLWLFGSVLGPVLKSREEYLPDKSKYEEVDSVPNNNKLDAQR